MLHSNSMQISLKTKITTIISGLVTLILFLISITVLLQWRSLILKNQERNTIAVSQAFSIPVLDVIISSNNEAEAVDLFEIYIERFMSQVNYIKCIKIYNQNGEIIAQSEQINFSNNINSGKKSLSTLNLNTFKHDKYGWIIMVSYPLQTAGKNWGILEIAFNAAPVRNEIRTVFFILLSTTILVIVFTLLLINYFIKRITNSLERLVEIIDYIDWDSDTPLKITTKEDEVGILVSHFRQLNEKLSQSRRQVVNAQKQIYRAEKLASIGRLASGVAHEINNPLNGIKGCLYSLQKSPAENELTTEYLELINEGITHIETVVQKLLGFARQKSKSIGAVNINEAIQKVKHLLDYRLNQRQTDVVLSLEKDLPLINADYHLIQEVIMNLLLNSYDAVGEKGKIEIKTGNKDSGNIYFTITDNGSGIAKEDIEKIFDPFYTTKDVGEGTGLGLSVVLGIVESHAGKINVISSPNKKTEFEISLPLRGEE